MYVQDLLAFIFILSSLHLLRYLTHLPYSDIGVQVTAITKLFFHPQVCPLYIVLVIFLLMFSMGFLNAFGNEINHFGGVLTSFHTMLNVLFGDFDIDVDRMVASNHIFSPFFVGAVMFILALVLMNILIAVVSELYNDVVAESEKQYLAIVDESADYEVKRFPNRFIKKVISLSFSDVPKEPEKNPHTDVPKKQEKIPHTADLLFGDVGDFYALTFGKCLQEATYYEGKRELNNEEDAFKIELTKEIKRRKLPEKSVINLYKNVQG